jgi:hypothetical protein
VQRHAANEESEMLDVGTEKLTERERECLKHFRQAQERGASFAEYCRSQGLKANEWHAVRHGMVHKGLLPGSKQSVGAKKSRTRRKDSRFIPVRLAAGGAEVSASGAACRLRHTSGWVIECASLPEVQWLKGLLQGAQP